MGKNACTSNCTKWCTCLLQRFVNSFHAIVPLTGQEKRGHFLTGVYLPQKLVLLPPIKRQYKPFPKHVSSYQVILCPGCFVYAQSMLRPNGTLDS
jgi:hypothetical protein